MWAATVTISLQDGCGFADRESAAWRSAEGSRAHHGLATPMEPHQGLPSVSNQLPLSPGRGEGGTTSSANPASLRTEWMLRIKKAGRRSRNHLREACGVANPILQSLFNAGP